MTKIQDKITYYDGSVATGKIVVTWPPFDYGGTAIAAGQQEYLIAPDGTVVIECLPCVGAQPVGTYYTATYELDKGGTYDEYWLVPSASSTTIGAIRVSVPETPSIMINAQQLTNSGAQSGMFLGWSGSGWVPMYPSSFNCAVRSFFGRTGDVMPLTGDYTVGQVTNAVPDSRRIFAGSGLAGGGPLTGDVTISVAAGGFVSQTTRVIAGSGLAGGGPLTGDVTLSLAVGAAVPPTTQIIAGPGLTGGGPLTGNVTLSVAAGTFALQTTHVIAGSGLTGGGPLTGDITLSLAGGFVPPTTQVIAGYGLTGGGPLTGNVTLAVADNGSIQKLQLALGGVTKATRHQLNFAAGSGVNLNLVDDGPNDQGTVTITAVSTGAPSPSIFSVDGIQKGIQPELNLISGSNVTLAGVNNSGAARVDITVTATGGGLVTSVFTRTGAVVALAADYAAFYVPFARQVLAGTGLSGGGTLSADVTLTAKAMVASGASHSAGMVPDPGATAGLTKFLREDATWVVPAYPADAVSSVFTRTGAVVALATDYSAFYVAIARQVIAGTGLTGGGALSADVTLTAKAMVASGASHSAGMVPDPPATAGTTRFLREDATWAVASGGGGQTPWQTDIDGAGFTLRNAGKIGVGNDATPPFAAAGFVHVIVGPATVSAACGVVSACSNTSALGSQVGAFSYFNYASTFADKRIASIDGVTEDSLDSGNIRFSTYKVGVAGERMRITAAGNVGIGNTASVSPGGGATDIQLIVGNTGAINGQYSALCLTGNTNVTTDQVGSIGFANYNLAAADKRLAAINCNTDSALNSGSLVFYTWNAGTVGERMRITAAGNVGIGVTPSHKLSMDNGNIFVRDSVADNSLFVYMQDTQGVSMSARNYAYATSKPLCLQVGGGTVGMGIANPTSKLHVFGSSGVDVVRVSGNSAGQYLALQSESDHAKLFHWNGSGWGSLALCAAGGAVGVGLPNPQVPFHVVKVGSQGPSVPAAGTYGGSVIISNDSPTYGMYIGSINTGNGYIQQQRGDSAVTYHLLLQPNGSNVGIGNSSPPARLSVTSPSTWTPGSSVNGLAICTFGSFGGGIAMVDGAAQFTMYVASGSVILCPAGRLRGAFNGRMVTLMRSGAGF